MFCGHEGYVLHDVLHSSTLTSTYLAFAWIPHESLGIQLCNKRLVFNATYAHLQQ